MFNFMSVSFIYLLLLALIYILFNFTGVLYLFLTTFTLIFIRVASLGSFSTRPATARGQSDVSKSLQDRFNEVLTNNVVFVTLKDTFHSLLNTSTSGKTKSMNNSFSEFGRLSLSSTRSPQQPSRTRVTASRRPSFSGRLLSPSPTVYRASPGSVTNAAGPLLSARFLPSVKRALGLDSISNSPVVKQEERRALYPQHSHAGFLPAVKLGRREKTRLDNSFSSVRSPNTVRIAPPDPHKLSSPRLFKVKPTNSNDNRRAPDTQAVVTALKEKSRKRALDGTELPFQEIPNQLAKRRRQESQQSNASTSSLPPLPDSLPDLTTTGYNGPRVKTPIMKQHEDTPPLKHPGEDTPSLKRTANMTDLTEADQEEHINKRAKTDPSVHNSLVSSLSSSRKIRQQAKRKVTMVAEEKENNKTPSKKTARFEKIPVEKEPSNSSLRKADTVILQPDFDETRTVSLTNNTTSSKEVTTETTTPPKPSVAPKMVSLNETFSARKRQMSFYSGLNETLKKAPQSQSVGSTEDYESDRLAEQKRGEELLNSLADDNDKAASKENKRLSDAKATLSALVNTSSAAPVVSSQSNTISITSTSVTPPVIGQSGTTPSTGQAAAVSKDNEKSSANDATKVSAPSVNIGFNFAKPSTSTVSSPSTSVTQTSLSAPTGVLAALAGMTSSVSTSVVKSTVSTSSSTSGVSGFTFSTNNPTPTPAATNPGSNTTGTTITTTSMFTFNAASPPKPAVTSGFSLGSSAPSSMVSSNLSVVAGFSSQPQSAAIATTSSAAPAPTGFTIPGAFAAPSTGGFTFGQALSAASGTEPPKTSSGSTVPPAAPTFNFGAVTASSSASSNPASSSFSFGQTSKPVTSPASAGFVFGASSITATTSAASTGTSSAEFAFTSNPVQSTSSNTPSTFTFSAGTTSAAIGPTPGANNFSFGSTPTPSFGAPATTKVGGFSFKPVTTTASGSSVASAPSFGQGLQGFGAQTSTTASSSVNSVFGFGQAPSTTVSTATGTSGQFAFGQSASTNLSSVPQSQSNSSVFQFGQGQSGAPSFSQSTTTTAGAAPFGQANTGSAGIFTFGSQPTSTTTSTPAFGAPQPSFGAPSGTSASSVFGSTNSTQGTGQGFGSQTGALPKPAFGTSQSTGPTFGATTNNAPGAAPFGSNSSFGSTAAPSGSMFQFTAQNPVSQAPMGFGASATPVFGAAGSGVAPAFGQPATTTSSSAVPAFGQSSASFGAPSSASTGAFPFGMTTPQKSAPAGGFNFGTPQNQGISGPSQSTPAPNQKGFDFAASAGGAPSFNFGSGNTSFGTPGGTPSFGATPAANNNMFSVGTGGTVQRPRTMARARRRTVKK